MTRPVGALRDADHHVLIDAEGLTVSPAQRSKQGERVAAPDTRPRDGAAVYAVGTRAGPSGDLAAGIDGMGHRAGIAGNATQVLPVSARPGSPLNGFLAVFPKTNFA